MKTSMVYHICWIKVEDINGISYMKVEDQWYIIYVGLRLKRSMVYHICWIKVEEHQWYIIYVGLRLKTSMVYHICWIKVEDINGISYMLD